MISYWCNAANRDGMDHYLETRGQPLAGRIEVRPYEELAPDLEVTGGAHIFAALDQLSASGRELVAALYDRLASHPHTTVLNDPRQVRLRYDLLKRLFEAGINHFAARRATERTDDLRFPVFVREESGHDGALTGLLANRSQLSRALLALRARGFRTSNLLVVEFCDLSNDKGFYYKAAAFKVGNAIVPAHLLKSRHWMIKWRGCERDALALREQLAYVTDNPHEAVLRQVFELAGVGFGRIDYGVRGQTLQVWEINLNPTISFARGSTPTILSPELQALLVEARTIHHSGLWAAFRALDPEVSSTQLRVRLDPGLIARVSSEAARARRRDGMHRFLQGVYHQRMIGRLLRMAYSRFLPRM